MLTHTDGVSAAKIPVFDVASRYTELGEALLRESRRHDVRSAEARSEPDYRPFPAHA